MRIGTCISKKGEISSGYLNISYKSDSVKLPIKIIQGENSGNVAFISAGMHGDELNGINIVSNFIKTIDPKKVDGTIIVAPILNPIGFRNAERRVTIDNEDLNRCFNIRKSSLSYKIADSFFKEIVSRSEFGMDFHDSNKRYILLPHTRIFRNENKKVSDLSRYFGTEIVMKRTPIKGMLSLEAWKKYKIPVLTIETGGGMNVSYSYYKEGINGLYNVLSYKDFLESESVVPERQFILDERIGYRSYLEGILTINRKLGNTIEKKEVIANIFNPVSEEAIQLESENPGVLFSIKASSHIKKNEIAFSILHFKRQRGQLLPKEGKMLINKETANIHISTTGILSKAMDLMKKQSKELFQAILKE